MSEKAEKSNSVTGKFSAYFAVNAAIGALLVAFSGMCIVLYVKMIRSRENIEFIKERTGIIARNAFGSPILWLDIICISVSLLLLTVILFFLFYRKEKSTTAKWIDYIEPVSSETIEEKDQFRDRTKLVVDTTQRSDFLDGVSRIRGVGRFQTSSSWGVGLTGGCSSDDSKPEPTDSDGNPSH